MAGFNAGFSASEVVKIVPLSWLLDKNSVIFLIFELTSAVFVLFLVIDLRSVLGVPFLFLLMVLFLFTSFLFTFIVLFSLVFILVSFIACSVFLSFISLDLSIMAFNLFLMSSSFFTITGPAASLRTAAWLKFPRASADLFSLVNLYSRTFSGFLPNDAGIFLLWEGGGISRVFIFGDLVEGGREGCVSLWGTFSNLLI